MPRVQRHLDIGGLPLLSQDKVWDRVRKVGLDELLQFDWTLVGESDAPGRAAVGWTALDSLDPADFEARLNRIREVVGERRRYVEILA